MTVNIISIDYRDDVLKAFKPKTILNTMDGKKNFDFDKLVDADKQTKKLYLEECLLEEKKKIWNLETELKYQERWQLIDVNRTCNVNGQAVPIVSYIKALKGDIEYLKGLVMVTIDQIEEIK